MNVLGLDHVQLAMPAGEEAAARAFYVDVLGLREEPKPAVLAARGGCWFVVGALGLHLGVEEPFRPARKAHPGLLVADLGACMADLRAAGVDVEENDAVAGIRRCYAHDPFGNRLEFVEVAPLEP